MCTDVFNAETGAKISSIGDLKAICRGNVYYRDDAEGVMTSLHADDMCLCPVDVPGTLVDAGYRVWRGECGEILFDGAER